MGQSLIFNLRRIFWVDRTEPTLIDRVEDSFAIFLTNNRHAISDYESISNDATGMTKNRGSGIIRCFEPTIFLGIKDLNEIYVSCIVPARNEIDVTVLVDERNHVIYGSWHVLHPFVLLFLWIETKDFRSRLFVTIFSNCITAKQVDFPSSPPERTQQAGLL